MDKKLNTYLSRKLNKYKITNNNLKGLRSMAILLYKSCKKEDGLSSIKCCTLNLHCDIFIERNPQNDYAKPT